MKQKVRVYLAGPIRGCTEEQAIWWRQEVKRQLRHLEFEDPVDWFKETGVPREVSKLAPCDLMLANMWRESIGTTVGIVRARQQGKPVVLLDPNRLHNPILQSLISPERPTHDIAEACERVETLAHELAVPLVVRNSAGKEMAFVPRRVAAAVSEAAAAAGVNDPALEALLTGPIISHLRRAGTANAVITTQDISAAVLKELDCLCDDPLIPVIRDLQSRAAKIRDKWNEHGRMKEVERVIRDADERVRRADQERDEWKAMVAALRAPQPVPPVALSAVGVKSGPRFKAVKAVMSAVSKKWGQFIEFHPNARKSAENIKPALSSRDLEKLHSLLEELGAFQHRYMYAAADDTPQPQLELEFGNRYALRESAETMRRYRTEPPYAFEGKRYFAIPHLKMRGGSGKPIRVYFDHISPLRLLVCEIGHRKTYGFDG